MVAVLVQQMQALTPAELAARRAGSTIQELSDARANQGDRELEDMIALMNRPYNHLVQLGAHNAFSSSFFGYGFNIQQTKSILTQMSQYYARLLMYDVHLYGDQAVHLCHTPCGGKSMKLQHAGGSNGEPVDKRFKDITDWLEGAKGPDEDYNKEIVPRLAQAQQAIDLVNNFLGPHGAQELFKVPGGPEAFKTLQYIVRTPPIITLLLEDYVSGKSKKNDNGALLDSYIEASGLGKYVLRPSDWDPVAQGGWPSLAWMIKNSKVVVIFTDEPSVKSAYMFPQWVHMVETNYSQMDPEKICKERRPKDATKVGSYTSVNFRDRPRYLYTLNRFPEFNIGTMDFAKENRKNGEAVNYCFTNGLEPNNFARGRYPNTIAIDHVHAGETYEVVLKGIWDEYSRIVKAVIDTQRKNGTFTPVPMASVAIDERFKEGGPFAVPFLGKLQDAIPAGFLRGDDLPGEKDDTEPAS